MGGAQDRDDTPSRSLPAEICMYCFFPVACVLSWVSVQQKTEAVTLHFGKYTGTAREPGCHFINVFGRDLRFISTAAQSIDLPLLKALDVNGNPLLVSAMVVFHVRHTKRAAIDVVNVNEFVKLQATAVLKRIAARYPYEHSTGISIVRMLDCFVHRDELKKTSDSLPFAVLLIFARIAIPEPCM